MVGIIIITHCSLGEELLNACRKIYGQIQQTESISIQPQDNTEEVRARILEAAQRLDTGDGVLILADGFGGSPANISLSVMSKINCEIVTGVNLNMLMEALCYQSRLNLKDLALKTESGGKRGIVFISEIYREKLNKQKTDEGVS